MWKPATIAATVLLATASGAEELSITVHAIDAQGVGEPIGSITFTESRFGGVLIRPDLRGMPPGINAFHLHENPDCGPGIKDGKPVAGLAAGGHYDPEKTGKHGGPYGDGHLGDLPALCVAQDGTATLPVLAPRISLDDLRGRSVMIHEGVGHYSEPVPHGAHGPRAACGVIP